MKPGRLSLLTAGIFLAATIGAIFDNNTPTVALSAFATGAWATVGYFERRAKRRAARTEQRIRTSMRQHLNDHDHRERDR